MKLGFIGCGKMATALLEGGLRANAFKAGDVTVSDALPAAADRAAQQFHVRALSTNAEVAEASDVLLLCVKPGDAPAALRDIGKAAKGKLLISIVAGLTLAGMARHAGQAIRFARVMPNTPALVGRGAAAFALDPDGSLDDATLVERIFSAVGRIFRVKEEHLDAVTGLSGSGPAYVYIIIEALADAGVVAGLPRDLALQLSAETVAGAAEMVTKTGLHPGQLKDMVASPGGTTIAGIEALEQHGLRAALLAAVRAATARSREIGAGQSP